MLQEIAKALQTLANITLAVDMVQHLPFDGTPYDFPQLRTATGELGETGAAVMVENLSEELRRKFDRFAAGENGFFSAKEFRKLCWSPDVVGTEAFRRKMLDPNTFPFTTSAVRGLLYCYHARFDELKYDGTLAQFLVWHIARYARSNARFLDWERQRDCILGPDAPSRFGEYAAEQGCATEKALTQLRLCNTTPFANRAAYAVAMAYLWRLDRLDTDGIDRLMTEILPSSLILREDFCNLVATLILAEHCERERSIQERVLDFVLRHDSLGDPRIRAEHWLGISDAARQRIIQWISREDILFFFELLIRDREDKHGRKEFWLEYIEHISRSRALVSPLDRSRNAVRLQELEDKGRTYGDLSGTQNVSAFVLDFGALVVVEFSQVGNACYIYTRENFDRILKEFWSSNVSFGRLKSMNAAHTRITHTRGWQSEARGVLAQHGIRRC